VKLISNREALDIFLKDTDSPIAGIALYNPGEAITVQRRALAVMAPRQTCPGIPPLAGVMTTCRKRRTRLSAHKRTQREQKPSTSPRRGR
jgi:hypothetical protein